MAVYKEDNAISRYCGDASGGIETYLERSQRCKFDACDVDAVALGLHNVAIYAWHSAASTV
jgi:hypothetical protein